MTNLLFELKIGAIDNGVPLRGARIPESFSLLSSTHTYSDLLIEEGYVSLCDPIDSFDNFNTLQLAKRSEKHCLRSFGTRRISTKRTGNGRSQYRCRNRTTSSS